MTAPEKAPKTMTNARAASKVEAMVQSRKHKSDETSVTTTWTFSALKRVKRNADPMRPIVEVAFMIAYDSLAITALLHSYRVSYQHVISLKSTLAGWRVRIKTNALLRGPLLKVEKHSVEAKEEEANRGSQP